MARIYYPQIVGCASLCYGLFMANKFKWTADQVNQLSKREMDTERLYQTVAERVKTPQGIVDFLVRAGRALRMESGDPDLFWLVDVQPESTAYDRPQHLEVVAAGRLLLAHGLVIADPEGNIPLMKPTDRILDFPVARSLAINFDLPPDATPLQLEPVGS